MSVRFDILPSGSFDLFVCDSEQELKPFLISDVNYQDVIQWFEMKDTLLDNISLCKIRLNEAETLFIADMKCPDKYPYGFAISALSRKDIYDILVFLGVLNGEME